MPLGLFDPLAAAGTLSPDFVAVRDRRSYAPARRLMERIFTDYPQRRREFVRDFQTRGFSARLWELALFAYLAEREYDLTVGHDYPDFIVMREGITAAIEATTTNPSQEGLADPSARAELPHVPADIAESQAELVFQLGKALRRKIERRNAAGRRYWEDPHVHDRPFVLAVEAFHSDTALYHGDSMLATYLYGLEWVGTHDEHGAAVIEARPVQEHAWRDRTIPSGFFTQPGTESVSAVLFSNAATISQFQRIAIERGLGEPGVYAVRRGTCYNPDPNALEPAVFSYEVSPEYPRETFAVGMRLFHNPNARTPLPDGFFMDVSEHALFPDGLVGGHHPPFVPFGSATYIVAATAEDEPESPGSS